MTAIDSIPDLWPTAALKADVLTPIAILRTQATRLGQKTQGVLIGDVTVITDESNQVVLSLELIVPALNNYRYRLLSVQHAQDAIYPAVVIAKGLKSIVILPVPDDVVTFPNMSVPHAPQPITKHRNAETAYSDKDFISIVQKVLQAPETIAFMQSLIVRSNEETSFPSYKQAQNENEKEVEDQEQP